MRARIWRRGDRSKTGSANRRPTRKDKGLAIAEQLGPDFTSVTQLPPEVRRDLDDDTAQTLGLMAQDNLDGRQVAPNGETSLMMNLIASQNPAAFAKEDLRLVRGKVTPEEYASLESLQQGSRTGRPATGMTTQRRIAKVASQISSTTHADSGASGPDRLLDWQTAAYTLSRSPIPISGSTTETDGDGNSGPVVLAAAVAPAKERGTSAGKPSRSRTATKIPWPALPPSPAVPLAKGWPIPGNHQPAQKDAIGSNGLTFSDGQYSPKGLYRIQKGKPHAHLVSTCPTRPGIR